jgi:hypothetical protein
MSDTVYGIIGVVIALAVASYFAYLCRKIAIKKNRGPVTWAILGFLLDIFAFIVLLMMSDLKEVPPKETQKINWIAAPGMIIGIMYLLYSVISIVLSFLDRTYADVGMNTLFMIIGIIFITFSTAFKNRQKWGWYGYTLLLLLVVILSIPNIDIYKAILAIFALGTMVFTFLPSVRKLYFAG